MVYSIRSIAMRLRLDYFGHNYEFVVSVGWLLPYGPGKGHGTKI
jgi:hypothetical protein